MTSDAHPPAPGGDAVRVLVIDDHPLVAAAIASTLQDAGLSVIATLDDVAALDAVWSAERPDVVVCDASLRRPRDGIAACAALRKAHPDARLLIYSAHTDRTTLLAATDAGVAGYVRKAAPVPELVAAVRDVAEGREGYDRESASAMIAALRSRRDSRVQLTPRERDVLLAMCTGITSTAKLSVTLRMGPETVKSHVASISAKLGVHDRAGIVSTAYRLGIVPDRRRA